MIYAFHIPTKSALFLSFNKGSKGIKEAGEGRREEGSEEGRKRIKEGIWIEKKKM